MLRNILIRWLIIAVSVGAAAWLVPGISIESNNAILVVILMALVLGLVNAVVRPILAFFSCGCIIATLGLFMLVVNAVTFWFAGWLGRQLGLGFYVDGFWPAFFGSLIVSIVSFLLSTLLVDEGEK